jgi:hypothetical protein
MALPPLYKYLNVRGAKLTLGNRTFRHAKPSDFNDTEDLTIQSIFPEDLEAALQEQERHFTDVILRHLNDPPTCIDPELRRKIALLQHIYRTNPDAADIVKKAKAQDRKPAHDIERMRVVAAETIKDVNAFMQGYRVFCATTLKASDEMWCGYAENHRGIALRIEPNVAKDSKFQLFRPVVYREKRPPMYESTLDFQAGSLFGDQHRRLMEICERVIYSKTLKWKHESEYRLAIPYLEEKERTWDTLPYHPEEITELYLGLAMEPGDKVEIVATARALNPQIMIFQVKRKTDGSLGFDRVTAPVVNATAAAL